MHSKCITAIRQAANGRNISDAKLAMIEDEIRAQMRQIARRDRSRWSSLSKDERIREAASAAEIALKETADRKELLAATQILKTEETNNRIQSAMELNGLTRSQGLIRDIENTNNYVESVRNEALSGLSDLIDASESVNGVGGLRSIAMKIWSLDNPLMVADVVREIFSQADGHTQNKIAHTAARAWLDTIESMRQRFNRAGGDIGKISYGYLTQVHDAEKVAATSSTNWSSKVLPLLDRSAYVNADGRLMSDSEVLNILESAYQTISTDGMNKTEPGAFKGTGARANNGSEARVIHFKNGDAWIAYMSEFGEGSLYDAMLGHIGKMAGDIGLIEMYGPNPERQFQAQKDIAERSDGKGTWRNRSKGNTPDAYWNLLTGKSTTPENPTVAKAMQDARNWQTASKLGRAVVASLTDTATISASLHFNRLPYLDMLKNLGRQLDSDHRDMLVSHGVIAESLISSMNRISGDHLTHSLSGKVASSVMRLTLMNAWTDNLRAAFASTMMQNFSKKVGVTWLDLDEWDRYLLQRKGITGGDWQIISSAAPSEQNGLKYLTRKAISEVDHPDAFMAANKWLAFVTDETQFAVLNPDMAARAIVTGGGMPTGTISGEIARTVMQFKSFPITQLTRIWGRILETPQGLSGAPAGFGAQTAKGATVNRIALLTGMAVMGQIMGAAVLQTKSLLDGKDPEDMTSPSFWVRALAQGGGLGYIGDWLLKDPTEQHGNTYQQGVGSVLGPVAGASAGLFGDVGLMNAWQAAKGEETSVSGDFVKWVNSNLPYVGMWQVKGIWDHWFMHNAQEAVNPGYLSRMQQRAMRDYGQEYYWQPGEATPDRVPDFAAISGE